MAEFNEITNATPNDADEVRENFNYLKCIYEEVGLNHIRQLKDRAIDYSSGNVGGYGEAYTDSTGRNDSVDNANTYAYFDTDKYKYNKDIEITDAFPSSSTGDNHCFITAKKKLTMTEIRFEVRTGFTGTILIKKNTVTVETIASASYSSNTYYTINIADVSLEAGDDFEVDISHTSGDFYFGQTDFVNDYFEKTSGEPHLSVGYTGSLDGYYKFKITEDQIITHTIPSGTFNGTVSSAILVPMIEDWEDGADIQFKYTNATEDSGWLSYSEASEFTAFTSEPTKLLVKLIPKATSPTAGYPSIKGVYYNAK